MPRREGPVVRMVPDDRNDGSTPSTEDAFHSILFHHAEGGSATHPATASLFADLNLDQVQQALGVQRPVPDLDALFTTPLQNRDAVRYRQEVFEDLQNSEVLRAIESFSSAMDDRKGLLEEISRSRHRLQQQSLSLEALEASHSATIRLERDLQSVALNSEALCAFRETLAALVRSERFTTYRALLSVLQEEAARLRYAVRIRGGRITVAPYDGQADHGAEVRSLFSRFGPESPEPPETTGRRSRQLDVVESRILDGVEALHPEVFAARARFLADPTHQMDPTVERFHRDVQFYLAWLDLVRPLRDAGLPFCIPEIVDAGGNIAVEDGFDVALATSGVSQGRTVVTNDFHLTDPERMLVVTGPNNGGKTTFARMVGQLLHLVAIGVPLPGRRATLPLPDRIFSHFEREEDSSTQVGRFLDELQRVQTILREATSSSVVILNESFSSTSLSEAVPVATRVVEALLERGCIGVYVTFMDEIASLSDQTVSMVAAVLPHDTATRTFRLVRAPADGRAHASAIAEKYGLTHEQLSARMRR